MGTLDEDTFDQCIYWKCDRRGINGMYGYAVTSRTLLVTCDGDAMALAYVGADAMVVLWLELSIAIRLVQKMVYCIDVSMDVFLLVGYDRVDHDPVLVHWLFSCGMISYSDLSRIGCFSYSIICAVLGQIVHWHRQSGMQWSIRVTSWMYEL